MGGRKISGVASSARARCLLRSRRFNGLHDFDFMRCGRKLAVAVRKILTFTGKIYLIKKDDGLSRVE
jgi:hypothetical protein